MEAAGEGGMGRALRLGGYAAWTATDQIVSLGVPRLVLFPILASMLGADLFGTFVIALSCIQLVGPSPSNGFVGYVIRDLSKHGVYSQRLLLRSTLLLSSLTVLPVSLFFVVGAKRIAGIYDDNPGLVELLPFLGAYLLLTNVVETSLTVHRVRRTFRCMVLVHSVQTALLFLAIPLYIAHGVTGIASAYLIAGAGALTLSLMLERASYLAWPVWSRTFVTAALRVWPWFSISAFIALSAGYLDRLLLGYWWSPVEVAPFFAAVSTASMFGVPATQLSNLVLSMLGRVRRRERFSRRFYALYGAAACASSVAVFIVGSLLGEFILGILYPSLLREALPLWNYGVGAFAILNVRALCRPFVVKFSSPKLLPVMAVANLTGRLVPLLLLVPSGGSRGAAQALLIGSCITALAWLCVYVRGFVFGRRGTHRLETCVPGYVKSS